MEPDRDEHQDRKRIEARDFEANWSLWRFTQCEMNREGERY